MPPAGQSSGWTIALDGDGDDHRIPTIRPYHSTHGHIEKAQFVGHDSFHCNAEAGVQSPNQGHGGNGLLGLCVDPSPVLRTVEAAPKPKTPPDHESFWGSLV